MLAVHCKGHTQSSIFSLLRCHSSHQWDIWVQGWFLATLLSICAWMVASNGGPNKEDGQGSVEQWCLLKLLQRHLTEPHLTQRICALSAALSRTPASRCVYSRATPSSQPACSASAVRIMPTMFRAAEL